MKTTILRLTLLICYCLLGMAQDVERGVERWAVKTSVPEHPRKKNVTLKRLLALPDPITQRKDAPDDEVIKKSAGGLKEGDIITTKGYLHLVALERDHNKHRDGDYHIQIRSSSEWGDSCFVVEVPFPDFIEDPVLKAKCQRVRDFVKNKLLNGNEPGTRGNIMQHKVYVTITGQLFYDAAHFGGNPRGKKGSASTPMHSYTCWELHPVTAMAFAR